jgi:hypothetical protein
MGLALELLFSCRRTKCVLESPSQFGNTAVSQQPSGSTGFAYATRGMRRGAGLLAFPLIHKLLFPERVLSVRVG